MTNENKNMIKSIANIISYFILIIMVLPLYIGTGPAIIAVISISIFIIIIAGELNNFFKQIKIKMMKKN